MDSANENRFSFPFKPYPAQLQLMEEIHACISNSQVGCLESPTGTGKSLSTICATFSWLKNYEKDIISEPKVLDDSEATDTTKQADEDWLSSFVANYEQGSTSKMASHDTSVYHEILKKIESSAVSKRRPGDIRKSVFITTTTSTIENDEHFVSYSDDDEEGGTSSDEEDGWDGLKLPKIIFCSRTHSQLSQFMREVLKTTFKDFRCVTLGGRRALCINPQVQSLLSDSTMNERCLEMMKSKRSRSKSIKTSTEAVSGTKKQRVRLDDESCTFKNRGLERDLSYRILASVQDIEDVVTSAKNSSTCPYFASKEAVKYAQVICMPYNMLLHEELRANFGVRTAGNVVIIDEAHNLIEAINQTHSAEVTLTHLHSASEAVKSYLEQYQTRLHSKSLYYLNILAMILKKLQLFVHKQVALGTISSARHGVFAVNDFLLRVGLDHLNFFQLRRFLQQAQLVNRIGGFVQHRTGVSRKSDLQSTLGLISCLTFNDIDGRIFVQQQSPSTASGSTSSQSTDVLIKYQLLNARDRFRDILHDARSVILLGGTMQPFSYFTSSILRDVPPQRLRLFSCNHIIAPSQLLPLVVTQGYSVQKSSLEFTHDKRLAMSTTNELFDVLARFFDSIPHGLVVFFASYKYLDALVARWKSDGKWSSLQAKKPIHCETKQQGTVEVVWESYQRDITFSKAGSGTRGAALFSVIGGRLSEGINFSDDLARGVVVVGMPFPDTRDLVMQEKIAFACQQDPVEGPHLPELLCMRAVNQAIGRSIRHVRDFAAIVLIDQRYRQQRVLQQLPAWIRQSMMSNISPSLDANAVSCPTHFQPSFNGEWSTVQEALRHFFERNFAIGDEIRH